MTIHVNLTIEDAEIARIVEDYQKMLILQGMTNSELFQQIEYTIIDLFPVHKKLDFDDGEMYIRFINWAKDADITDLERVMLSGNLPFEDPNF